MSIITLPASFPLYQVQWTLDRPAQVNRSGYSGSRKVVANPWHGMWRAHVELATVQGEANFRALRAFLASLKGQINTFQMPATEGAQYTLASAFAVPVDQGNTTVVSLGSGVYTVEKTAGTSAWGNAAASSAVPIYGDFTARFKCLALGGSPNGIMMGMNSDPLTDTNFSSIDRTLYAVNTTTDWQLYESGSSLSIAATGTYGWIWRISGVLYYGVGATLAAAKVSPLRSVADTSPLYFDSSLWTVGDKIEILITYDEVPTVQSATAQGSNTLVLVTGAELVTNGTFTGSTTGWSAASGATLSAVANALHVLGSVTNYGGANQTLTLVASAAYGYSFDHLVSTVGKIFQISPTGYAPAVQHQLGFATAGSASGSFTMPAVTTALINAGIDGTTGYVEYDNISVRKAPVMPTVGMLATVPLPSGNKQLVMITGVSNATITFEPPLREAVPVNTPVEVINPYCQVALSDSAFGWGVEPWRRYRMSFDVEEAF